jgi:hypothetical protein
MIKAAIARRRTSTLCGARGNGATLLANYGVVAGNRPSKRDPLSNINTTTGLDRESHTARPRGS